jgi:hypothetical protein
MKSQRRIIMTMTKTRGCDRDSNRHSNVPRYDTSQFLASHGNSITSNVRLTPSANVNDTKPIYHHRIECLAVRWMYEEQYDQRVAHILHTRCFVRVCLSAQTPINTTQQQQQQQHTQLQSISIIYLSYL